jgi:O-methyltransferase involved in polyketide biosynthesis
MKNDKLDGLDDVAETLLIPLCYRAEEARKLNPLIRDPKAQGIIDQLGIYPAHLKWRPAQQTFAMLRARQFDRWAGDFIAGHPRATVVEIGCGLDARFERLDDGRVTWVDLDLPSVIDLRRRFFKNTPRRQMMASSLFALDWMNYVPHAGDHLFLAEDVLPYFEEGEVRRVFMALAGCFPGAQIVVDALSPFMVRSSAVIPWFRGYQVRPRWAVSDPKELESWGCGIRLLDCYAYFDAPELRLENNQWMSRLPVLRDSARVLRLKLG